jgi:hypothetical protein
VRASLALVALIVLVAGCGSSTSSSKRGAPDAGSLDALWRTPTGGQSVALIPGTSDYSPGDVRVSFLVVDPHGRVSSTPHADVWVARSLRAKPFAHSVASLEPIGVPGVSTGADAKAIYVAHVRVPASGHYQLVARPIGGGKHIAALGDLVVRERSQSPMVGTHAYPSQTPTLASTGGRTALLTTSMPPDRALLRTSIAGALAAHVPFVVTFATPRYCESRICGPVVDVVNNVRKQYAPRGVRFIHVEIYRQNNPSKGPNLWVRQWHLPGEPWTFLVGRDGTIKGKFQGSVSTRELGEAIGRLLL